MRRPTHEGLIASMIRDGKRVYAAIALPNSARGIFIHPEPIDIAFMAISVVVGNVTAHKSDQERHGGCQKVAEGLQWLFSGHSMPSLSSADEHMECWNFTIAARLLLWKPRRR